MTTEIANAIQVLADDINTKTDLHIYAPKANGGAEPLKAIDPSIENMDHASGLSADALLQIYTECATRAEAEVAALEKVHMHVCTVLKEEAAAARARGAKVAQLIRDYGQLAQAVATASAASTQALREAEPK